MDWGILVLIVGVGLLGFLLLHASKRLGESEAELKTSEAELKTIIENRKAKYENIHIVNNLSEPERARLRDKWTKK